MAAGCLVASCLWLAFVSLVLGSTVPVAVGLILGAALLVYRWRDSDWPLY